jgi:hypothetical protein
MQARTALMPPDLDGTVICNIPHSPRIGDRDTGGQRTSGGRDNGSGSGRGRLETGCACDYHIKALIRT